jgi:imidazolonepropionase-like amidohydrolase
VDSDPRSGSQLPDGVPVNGLPPLVEQHEREAQLMARIAAAGGSVTVGSHGDYDGFGFHMEMWSYARGGMDSHTILRAATLNGAHAAGVHADVGSIEVGKIADLVILDKNPLEDIRNTLSVERVMKDGVLREANTLDEVWPNRTPLPAWKYEAR